MYAIALDIPFKNSWGSGPKRGCFWNWTFAWVPPL